MDTQKLLVIKVGTNVLSCSDGSLDLNVIESIIGQIYKLRKSGHLVVLVTSGACGAARTAFDFKSKHSPVLKRQMMSSIGQPHLMNAYLDVCARYSITGAQALLTRNDFKLRKYYLSIKNTLISLLHEGILPIINENDVLSDEAVTFGDNDMLSAAIAATIFADKLFLLTQSDGFYSGDPHQDKDSRRLSVVPEITKEMWDWCGKTISLGGSGGMLSKLKAVETVVSFGIEAHIACGKEDDIILRIMNGEDLGTRFIASPRRLEGYKRWLKLGALTKGYLVIDDGARQALINKKSLLPVGISRVQGKFENGDIVEIYDQQEQKIGIGMVNFGSEDLTRIVKGLDASPRSQEAIHRDQLLITSSD